MDLTLFPFDKQLCKLGIESCEFSGSMKHHTFKNFTDGYTADHVVYKWSTGARTALELKKIRLPDFTIQEAYVTSQMESYATGNYSRLYVCFVFSRSSGFCFLQLIIPSTAVVITSWVSLWMETETEFQVGFSLAQVWFVVSRTWSPSSLLSHSLFSLTTKWCHVSATSKRWTSISAYASWSFSYP